MSSENTVAKPRKKTGGFASRMLHKQLTERKRPSFEFSVPSIGAQTAREEPEKKEAVAGK